MAAPAPSPLPILGPAPPGGLDAPAARRNAAPLLSVLTAVLPGTGTVLEVGAGTGQHAAAFAPVLAPRDWLPTDRTTERFASIQAWSASLPTDAARPLPPQQLDATEPPDLWPLGDHRIRAIVSVNVIHIAPWAVAEGLLAGAVALLGPGDPLILYGPFARRGSHTGPGNARFDAALRAEDPSWGVRDLDREIVPTAEAAGLTLDSVYPMPADNLTVVLRVR